MQFFLTSPMSHPNAAQLQALMAQANIDGVIQLAQCSGVPARQIYRLQQGLIHSLPVEAVVQLAQYFDQSVDEFLSQFLPTSRHPIQFTSQTLTQSSLDPAELETLKAEGDRLRIQLADQAAVHAEELETLQTERAQLKSRLDHQAVNHADELAALQTEYDRLETQLAEQAVTHATAIDALKAEGDRHHDHDVAQPAIDPTEFAALQAKCDRLEAQLAEQAAAKASEIDAIKAEYERLEAQLTEQGDRTQAQWQQEALDILESWLLQWSAAASAAQDNPNFPAKTLVALAQPFEQLLESWNVTPIATVGAKVAYDPQKHQLVHGGLDTQPGDIVMIQNVGYQQGDRLLHRAKVISQ